MNVGVQLAIAEVLNRVPFVRWDRFVEVEADQTIGVYGWIDRADGRSDFVLVEFGDFDRLVDGWVTFGFTTSSHERGEEVHRLLYQIDDASGHHVVCQRVEHELPAVENAVKSGDNRE